MSPQLLWAIAGLAITVLSLGSVTLSSVQSLDSATNKLIASEVANVATASRFWLINASATSNFSGISAQGISKFIPDLAVSGSDASSLLASKVSIGITYAVSSTTPFNTLVITASNLPYEAYSGVKTALTGKACALAEITPATPSNADGKLTFTCNS